MATGVLKPLTGIRVVDFSRVLAGPFCTMMLADLGAEVIKIEHPTRGDDTRHWGPPYIGGLEKEGMSSYFCSVNRNKKSIGLDLKNPRGAALARQLVTDPRTHIVVENFKVGGMASYGGNGEGLDYDSVSRDHPALVYCSITGFGQTGPYSERPGYDFGIQAMSGLMSITGSPDGDPQKVGVAISDVIAGLNAANGIQAALRLVEKTGQGQHVDISLLDTQIAALENVAINYLTTKKTPRRVGNAHPTIVPWNTFHSADGHQFIVAAGNDGQFQRLCTLLQKPEWSSNPKFSTNPARVANREVLLSKLDSEFVKHSASYWVEKLLDVGVPAAPIYDIGETMEDRHVRARNMVQEITFKARESDDTSTTVAKMVGSPMKLSNTPIDTPSTPPFIGQHTDMILEELSISKEEINDLREHQIIS